MGLIVSWFCKQTFLPPPKYPINFDTVTSSKYIHYSIICSYTIQVIRQSYNNPINFRGWDKYCGWGIVDADAAYDDDELLEMGCVAAWGITTHPIVWESNPIAK